MSEEERPEGEWWETAGPGRITASDPLARVPQPTPVPAPTPSPNARSRTKRGLILVCIASGVLFVLGIVGVVLLLTDDDPRGDRGSEAANGDASRSEQQSAATDTWTPEECADSWVAALNGIDLTGVEVADGIGEEELSLLNSEVEEMVADYPEMDTDGPCSAFEASDTLAILVAPRLENPEVITALLAATMELTPVDPQVN